MTTLTLTKTPEAPAKPQRLIERAPSGTCTVREWCAVQLVARYNLTPEEAREIVAAEVAGWETARLPFAWDRDIRDASKRTKSLALYCVTEAAKKVYQVTQ